MSILDLPNVKITDNDFGLQSNAIITRSIFNGRVTTAQRLGSTWVGSYTVHGMKANSVEARQWKSWLAQLDGASGRFYAFDPDIRTFSGTGNGTPVVNGVDQKGFSLITDGWDNSETVLLEGDYIEFNNEYHMVTADVTSDGSGNASISIAPEIRISPPDGEAVVITNPQGIFMLTEAPIWLSNKNKVITLTISFVEAFDYKTFLLTEAGDNLTTEADDRLIL